MREFAGYTLYATSPNRYLSLDGENIVILEQQEEIGRVPHRRSKEVRTCRSPVN